MRTVFALVVLAIFPAAGWAQADLGWPAEFRVNLLQDEERSLTATLFGRATWIEGGEMFSDTADWSEFYQAGAGAGLELSYMIGAVEPWGVYLSVGADMYEAEAHRLPGTGTSIESDNLLVGFALAGIKAEAFVTDWLQWEGRIGAGAVGYDDVEAESTTGGVTTEDLELFERGARVAGEAGMRLKLYTGGITLALGVGARFQNAPDDGDDFEGIESERLETVFGEFSIVLRF